MSAYSEKLKGIGFLSKMGTSTKKRVESEKDGTTAGYHVEHWNDSQDAVVLPKTIELTIGVKE